MGFVGAPGPLGPPGGQYVMEVREWMIGLNGLLVVVPSRDNDIANPQSEICLWDLNGFVYFKEKKYKYIGSDSIGYFLWDVDTLYKLPYKIPEEFFSQIPVQI
jgi:hypothetical protein